MFDFLKRRSKREQPWHWRNDERLQRCLQAMRGNCTVAIPDQREAAEAVARIAVAEGPWAEAGTVPADFLSEECFVIWDRQELPVFHCKSEFALAHLEDLLAVGSEVFLVSDTLDRTVRLAVGTVRLWPEHS